jgi:hypothetical protein
MRWFRIALRTVLTMLLFYDTALVVQYHKHGLDIRFTDCVDGPAPGEVSCKMVKNTFTAVDYWIFAALIGVHLLLVYLLWHFRKRRAANS